MENTQSLPNQQSPKTLVFEGYFQINACYAMSLCDSQNGRVTPHLMQNRKAILHNVSVYLKFTIFKVNCKFGWKFKKLKPDMPCYMMFDFISKPGNRIPHSNDNIQIPF